MFVSVILLATELHVVRCLYTFVFLIFKQLTSIMSFRTQSPRSFAFAVLAWPAWLRVLAILPAILALWLGVLWALAGESLW